MSEATKPQWAWDARANWIDIFDPSGEHWLQFDVDDDTRKATEEKVGKLVNAMNMRDGLVAVAEAAKLYALDDWDADILSRWRAITGSHDPTGIALRRFIETALAAEAKVAEVAG